MFKKILYIGSGDDLKPLDEFLLSDFVYVDGLPRNEYGFTYYDKRLYDRDFKRKVVEGLDDMSFRKTSEKKFSDEYSEINVPDLDPHVMSFSREEQRLRYYFSTAIPDNGYNEELCNDISECDAILVKGHWPNKDVLKYIKPFHFIGSETTFFPKNVNELDTSDRETLMYAVLENPKMILTYSYLAESGDIDTFSTYQKFYNKKYYI